MSVRVMIGDCRDVLATLPDASVQCCVTSPPYWGLRDYGVTGQIGLERTPDEYVAQMVAVFREVRRVLRDDGVCWINLGDSYASAWVCNRRSTIGASSLENGKRENRPNRLVSGLKEKDLVGIPWMVAFALRADGWYLRSDIIWAKPNPMPESVTDRPTKSHEYLFLLTKSPSYFYDADAIAEPASGRTAGNANPVKGAGRDDPFFRTREGLLAIADKEWHTRNARSVWTVATQPLKMAHFATFPPKLIEPCILAGTSPQACEHCAAPWERVTEKGASAWEERKANGEPMRAGVDGMGSFKHMDGRQMAEWKRQNPDRHLGWRPTCDCENNTGAGRCVVLDPFGGAGTTGLVADRLGRDAVLIELNPAYAALGSNRITDDAPLFADVDVDGAA